MPFLSHVLVKSNNINTPDQEINLFFEENSKNNNFSFNINIEELNTYSFYLYRKSIDGYYGNRSDGPWPRAPRCHPAALP